MLCYQYRMELNVDSISDKQRQKQHIQETIDYYKRERDEYKAYLKEQKMKENKEEVIGCWDVLKKLSCTLQCGGKSCSIKETEQKSGSTTPSTPSSLESVGFVHEEPKLVNHPPVDHTPEGQKPITTAPKRRKRSQKKTVGCVGATQEDNPEPSVPAVKKVRKISKKKQQLAESMDHTV